MVCRSQSAPAWGRGARRTCRRSVACARRACAPRGESPSPTSVLGPPIGPNQDRRGAEEGPKRTLSTRGAASKGPSGGNANKGPRRGTLKKALLDPSKRGHPRPNKGPPKRARVANKDRPFSRGSRPGAGDPGRSLDRLLRRADSALHARIKAQNASRRRPQAAPRQRAVRRDRLEGPSQSTACSPYGQRALSPYAVSPFAVQKCTDPPLHRVLGRSRGPFRGPERPFRGAICRDIRGARARLKFPLPVSTAPARARLPSPTPKGTFANFMPSWFVESNTSSMMPLSLGRIAVEASRLVNREGSPSAVTAAAGVVLPMMMSVPETRTPGETMPSASTFSYEPCLIAVQSPRSGRSNTSCWPAFSPTPLECSWSVYVRKKCDRKRPRSMALWFMIRLSSWL
mmetsp:Transcript_5008/g.17706  ORF Transcript_5008/g.17706 Transcript_5008/m.17706 type:complete len:400 (-) Transcript_5008:2453-3652(-)